MSVHYTTSVLELDRELAHQGQGGPHQGGTETEVQILATYSLLRLLPGHMLTKSRRIARHRYHISLPRRPRSPAYETRASRRSTQCLTIRFDWAPLRGYQVKTTPSGPGGGLRLLTPIHAGNQHQVHGSASTFLVGRNRTFWFKCARWSVISYTGGGTPSSPRSHTDSTGRRCRTSRTVCRRPSFAAFLRPGCRRSAGCGHLD